MLNGQPKTKATLARVMGYVEQNDIHTPALTVVESLQFSAHLRLDRNVNKRQEHKFVDDVGSAGSWIPSGIELRTTPDGCCQPLKLSV